MELGIYDNNLTADSVIALRIAFKFFIDGGSYEMDFNGFRQNIYGLFNVNDTIKSLAKFEYIMNLNHVIQSIRFFRNHIWNPSNFFDSIVNRLDMRTEKVLKDNEKSLTYEAIVFKNAASAEFGDLFVRYVSTDDDFADDDDNGNVVLTSEEIKKQRIITILFTTKAINPDLHYSIRSAIPDDVLVVCRDNFHQHFGIFGTALKDSLRDLKLKRPFHSPKDFKDRVAFKDRVSFDNDDGINAGSRMHAPFQKRKVLQTRVAFQTIT
ncbi:hypothetical protein RirG_189620 [Rhizophagus irregularis DAOM 197198w]|uniref:Uncharacterized protein n=1 Tax=Rhizophagus irregularis (strain DAOM 197198w) TaxID=1432141 RepID=A0A015IY99_RHIIW|nr:hypothetical protein RirG_189620 [Rhizophagus irregularis DAOM 197198w]